MCHYCKKTGHIQRACTKRGKAAVDHLGSDDSESGDDCPNVDSDNFLACLEVNSVGNKADVIWVTPVVDGKPLKMELDTGSAVSVIPYKQFKKRFSLKKLQKSEITLKTYTGEKITPRGKINCSVEYKGQTKQLNVQIIETPGPALFGRDWLSEIKLDWGEI